MRRIYVLSLGLSILFATAVYAGCSDPSDSATPSGTGATGGGGGSGGSDASAGTGGTGGSSTGGSSTGGGDTGGSSTGGGDTGGSSTGGGDTGGSSAGGSGVQDAAVDVDFGYDAPAYEAPEACATAAVQAQLKPLDLYMMVDRSGSMTIDNRWTNQSNALKAFFNDGASAGITVAMRFFPLDDACSPQNSQCNGNAYATPLVDWGLLNGHAGTLNAAIDNSDPGGCFTPTQEAINGVLKGALARQNAEPNRVVVAVIVSDGEPCCDDCPIEEAGGIGAIAGQYFAGTPSIRTFAIYVASVAGDVMTQIAQQGGTNQAFNATAGSQAFIDALKAIQGSAIPCDFDMPDPSQGTVDPDEVTLNYLPGGTGTPITVPRVNDQADCANHGNEGWYYDNNTAPTKITLCSATCATMKADPNAKVSIELGCLGS